MAMYDSLGVPVLGFHNPAGSIFYPKGLYTYAIGNTRGRNVLETLGTKKGQHLDLLLLASGDVRNLLFSISELSLRKPSYQPKSISFHINDYDPSVVARNVVILELVDTINPDVPDDIDFLWNVWYNMTLSKAHLDRLRELLTSLIERNFEGDESFLKFQARKVRKECRDIWMDWRELHLNDIHSVKKERNQVMEKKPLNNMMNSLCVNVISQVGMAPWDVSEIISTESSFYQEIEHWFREGSTNDELAVNPTLIRPFVHKWRVHYGACAFEGYLPFQREELLKSGSFTAACKERLKLLVTQFQQHKHVTSIQVTSWTGDALWLCTSGLPRKLLFDVIDTSNISDHIGLLNVLVCCGARLKRPLESQLFTSSILWCEFCESIEEYYNRCIGVPPYLLPTVLGLKLAVDFDLGSRKLPDKLNRTEEILCWVKTETTRTLLKIDENSDITQALHRLVERCFNPVGDKRSQVYGLTLPSPLTLLRIIQQIYPLIDGGAARILDILHGKLPPDFCQKFGLSWNLIEATVRDKKEPIVEVEVSVECSAVPLLGLAGDHTPMPMIVIHNKNRNERKSIEKSMVIYNSLRYDVDLHVVKFHLVEKDWKELNETSWLEIVTNNEQPLITSNTVFLGSKSGATLKVTQVDPVATFGLFSVQTFNVCSPQEDHLLEVIKVEESEYLYKAELAMRDPSKCQASNMKINFLPDSCPAAVNINFGEVTGCTMYFSCSIETSSKFQISRKLGKITCLIPKRQDGTVGELVLRNPPPIPFHAFPHWKSGVSDAILACGRMFRTKLDMQLKSQRKDGSPFFDLRESISILIKEHLKQPPRTKVYCVEGHPLIDGLYETSDDILLKKGFIIRVEKVYLWKNLPIAKILFYDCKHYGDIIKKVASREASRLIKSFFKMSFGCQPHRIVADQKEIDLFRKMLGINAARTTQEHNMSNSVWKASFVCPIFPQRGTNDGIDLGEVKLPTTTVPRNLFEASSILSQIFNAPTNPETDINVDTASSSVTLGETECRYCHKKSENLKRCTGCKKVSYCDKDCQRRHWKLEHKTQCKK